MGLSVSTTDAIAAALAETPPAQTFQTGPSWDHRLPAALLHVWDDYGLVELADGRLRLIDSAALAP